MPEFQEGKSELTAIARRDGWSKAIAQQFGTAEYLTDERRGIFLGLLPIDAADVLEIGPGFGQFTDRIARLAKSVAALEVDPEQADFIREKLRQEGIANTTVTTGGADCRLPYSDHSFDLVILNLVLEWCATATDEAHEVVQLRLLREIARVLRPGGRLYVATKNRFALRYLIGKPDEHYHNMRFGSALPRWLADRVHGRRSRGRLYSWRGLWKLLRQAGFEVEQSWWAAPEMRFPEKMVRTDPKSIREARRAGIRQGDGRAERLLLSLVPAPLVKHVAPGLSFLARI
ncbi:MAG: methyltransferase domain-containing protein [Sphingomicrobium sp.]